MSKRKLPWYITCHNGRLKKCRKESGIINATSTRTYQVWEIESELAGGRPIILVPYGGTERLTENNMPDWYSKILKGL